MSDQSAKSTTTVPLAWKEVPIRFAVHIAIGAAMFMLVGAVAVLLHEFVHWMEIKGLHRYAIYVVSSLKWGIFAGDVYLFGIYLGRTLIHHSKTFWTVEVQ
jgi:hypothetical protein